MIFNLFRPDPTADSIAALYGTIVAQARQPAFYALYGVADTPSGRLDMIILHLVLVLARLEREDPAIRRMGQRLFDHFCSDMDANLREMGVGDLAVPRRMKSIGEAFYGHKRAYQAALKSADPQDLEKALARNVGAVGAGLAVPALAAYVRTAAGRLAGLDPAALAHGDVRFPAPATDTAAAGAT